MEKTWKLSVAAVLDMVAGLIMLILGCLWAIMAVHLAILSAPYYGGWTAAPWFIIPILGIIALVGSVYVSKAKRWKWAVIGSACAALVGLGILALIFVIRSKKDFE